MARRISARRGCLRDHPGCRDTQDAPIDLKDAVSVTLQLSFIFWYKWID